MAEFLWRFSKNDDDDDNNDNALLLLIDNNYIYLNNKIRTFFKYLSMKHWLVCRKFHNKTKIIKLASKKRPT